MCVQDQPHLLVLEGDLPGGRSNNDVGITSSHKLRDANVGFGQAYHIANKWAPIPEHIVLPVCMKPDLWFKIV